MEQIRILQVLDSLDYGGVEMFLMNLYKNIDKTKVQFDFLIFKENNCYENDVKVLGSKVFKYEINGSNKISKFLNKIKYIKKIVKQYNYKIVHCHNCSIIGMLSEIIGARLAKSESLIIAHSHNTGMPKDKCSDKIFRAILKEIVAYSANYYFACSEKAALSKYPSRKLKGMRYWKFNNAIDVNNFSFNSEKREEIRKKLCVVSKYVVGNVGRFEYQKNHLFLLEVFAEILKANKEAVLLLVGSGSLEDEIKEKAELLGVKENIIFSGSVKNVSDMYLCMDTFVLTSHYEGLGIVLIEAQTSGLPCVVSSKVPKEAKVTELISFMDLDKGSKKWSEVILESKDKVLRKSNHKEVALEGYDIKIEAKKLESFYLTQYEKIISK